MSEKPLRGLFITGTDTGVGKTYVTTLLARSLTKSGKRVGVYKPVASGCEMVDGQLISEDAECLRTAIGGEVGVDNICPQRFAAPLAPHLSARAEGKSVDADLLRSGISFWNNRCDILLVEGVGGLMSPVSDEDYTADLACDFGYPLLIVAPNALGVINQTLQTLITASTFREGLDVAGIVLNDTQLQDSDVDPSVNSNRQQLESHCVPPVLTHVNWQASEFDAEIDWIGVSGGGQAV
jgi:dethiobiotin synthetase